MLSRFATSLAVSARFWANSWSAARSATVLPPAFSPSPRNDAAQLSGGPHCALLNNMLWPTFLFTWNEMYPFFKRPRDFLIGTLGSTVHTTHHSHTHYTLS